jgi:hypothetical protein
MRTVASPVARYDTPATRPLPMRMRFDPAGPASSVSFDGAREERGRKTRNQAPVSGEIRILRTAVPQSIVFPEPNAIG